MKKIIIFIVVVVLLVFFGIFALNLPVRYKVYRKSKEFKSQEVKEINAEYDLSTNTLNNNTLELNDGIKISLQDYQNTYDESKDAYEMEFCIQLEKENSILNTMLYDNIVYSNEYILWSSDVFILNYYPKYGDELKNKKLPQNGLGFSIFRTADELSSKLKETLKYVSKENYESNNFCLELYNIRYQADSNKEYIPIDNTRVKINLNIK